jgi:hypothetical protein
MRIVKRYELQREVSTTDHEQNRDTLRVTSGTCQSSYGKIAALEVWDLNCSSEVTIGEMVVARMRLGE